MIFNDEDDKDDLVNSQASPWSIGLCGLQVEKRQWSVRFLISGLVFTKFVLEKVVGEVPDQWFRNYYFVVCGW